MRMRENLGSGKLAEPLELKYECEKCKDLGYIETVSDTGYEIYKPCTCQIKKQNERNMQRANYKKAFENKNFDNYKSYNKGTEALKEICIEFTKQEEARALLLLGNVGSGKTHLAVATLKEFAKNNYKVNAVNYTELVRKLSSVGNDQEAYYNILGRYISTRVLLLDDLFKGQVSPANIKQMYELINKRYEDNKFTIITSEYNFEKLLDLDEAIASRLGQMTNNKYLLNITKLDNYRLKK